MGSAPKEGWREWRGSIPRKNSSESFNHSTKLECALLVRGPLNHTLSWFTEDRFWNSGDLVWNRELSTRGQFCLVSAGNRPCHTVGRAQIWISHNAQGSSNLASNVCGIADELVWNCPVSPGSLGEERCLFLIPHWYTLTTFSKKSMVFFKTPSSTNTPYMI